MPFGMVSGVGLRMGVLDFGGDRRRGRGSLGGGVPLCCVVSARVYCGKTADWIRMPFGGVSGVGLGMGVLDFGGDRQRERGSLGGGEFAASHYNQWGLCCIVVWKCVQRSSCRLAW